MMSTDPEALPDNQLAAIVDTINEISDEGEVSIGDVIERLGVASFTPVLLMVSIVIVTPLSGVPGLSSVCGLLIALVSGQLLLGRNELWLPGFITCRAMPGRKFNKTMSQVERPLGWVQDITTRRLAFLTTPPVSYLLYTICLICGAAMPFLELVPMSSSLLALVVALLSIALISKDGLFTLVGLTSLASVAALLLTIKHLIT